MTWVGTTNPTAGRPWPPFPKRSFEEHIAATSHVHLPRGTNPWAATDLLVSESVSGTIEPADVEALRFRAGGVAGDDDSIARLQGLAGHADFGKLRAVVHIEPPLLLAAAVKFDVDRHERMRIDKLELRDNTFDGHLSATVVNGRNRMMRSGRHH